jgi:hypothetical protein
MHCPLHDDAKRSASLNIKKAVWYCNACDVGGTVKGLIQTRKQWLSPSKEVAHTNGASKVQPRRQLSYALVDGWHSALLSNSIALDWLNDQRGLTRDTIVKYKIGYKDNRLYTIPVWDKAGLLVNIRYYNPRPKGESSKIKSEYGFGSPPRLYPLSVFDDDPKEILIVEGEWDALLANQSGYPAITRTASAKTWHGEWGEWFVDRTVYLCHDADEAGQDANVKVARSLARAADVRIVQLPYSIRPKHGQDITDFLLEYGIESLQDLLDKAVTLDEQPPPEPEEVIKVLESFDAERVGVPVKLHVTIKGRKEPGYTLPKKVHLRCTRDAGTKCQICPLNPAGGDTTFEVPASDPAILKFLDSNNPTLEREIGASYGIPGGRCVKLKQSVEEYQSVEVLFGRSPLDYSDGTKASEYRNIRIISVGHYDTPANTTIATTGALFPNPKGQTNEFQAWEVELLETSVDKFTLDPSKLNMMNRFRTENGQRPLKKAAEIARSLSEHVTSIHGRLELHMLMDLVFHSALSFNFGGQLVERGWLDVLIVGDTRTGKSETAQRLVRHYRAGEIIGGESASFAGLVGGLQQLSGRDWAVTWGVIPINDRRLVVIDEVSGLTHDDIARMSDIRASGVARLTKIQQDVSFARTRLLWLGNPRNTSMSNYTYGVDSIVPLIGNAEDIARFDLAMALRVDDVDPHIINKPTARTPTRFTSEACHSLLMWTWTRRPEHIVFEPEAEKAVFDLANEVGKQYVEQPPLVQSANIRIKIARIAVALAARTFSTDEKHERIMVKRQHVYDAVTFLNHLYGMQAFGYRERSREALQNQERAEHNRQKVAKFLKQKRSLAEFLRSAGTFRRQDIEEVLDATREEANAIIHLLWTNRMIRKEKADIRVEPTLHDLLRGKDA